MTNMCFTPEQCKAGRALLSMKRSELAELSGVAVDFIKSFENRTSQASPAAIVAVQSMMRLLAKRGCIFTNLRGVSLKDVQPTPKKTELEQRYVDGKKVLPEHLSAADFERIGMHVSSDNFIFDERARTAYVELELHTGASPSAVHKINFLNNDALDFTDMRKTLRAKAYLDAFFTLKRSGHIA